MTNTKLKHDDAVRAELVALKLAVINIHPTEEFKYVRMNAARDACFTSHNSMSYKSQQMTDVRDELADATSGNEPDQVKVERKIEFYTRLENELFELTLRHEADLAVYEEICEEKWRPGPRKKKAIPSQGTKSRLAEILAK